jgi:short-subunit dehydrogenase
MRALFLRGRFLLSIRRRGFFYILDRLERNAVSGVQLRGAKVVVTGASSGIGAATARALADKGATVALVARRGDRLEQVLADCPGGRAYVADLSELDALDTLASRIDDELGGIDVLVNNAGAPKRRHVTALTPAEVEQVMSLNYFSPIRLSLALLPKMLGRGSGLIVNVASLGGRIGIATESAYCASKFALAGWSEAAAIDLAGTGVGIRLINPGAFQSEIWDQPENDAPFFEVDKAPPEECAQAIVRAIEGERFETYAPDLQPFVVGKTGDVDAFIATMTGLTKA